jgi:hypothetical protein
MALANYLRDVKDAIVYKNGSTVANLLSFQNSDRCSNQRLLSEVREDMIRSVVYKPWDELVVAHLLVCRYLSEGQVTEAFKEQQNLMQAFTKVFQSLKDDNWPLPALFVVCRDLRQLAVAADRKQQARKSKPHENVEKAADLLMAVFRVCATDIRAAPDRSKRRGMITIVNQLFKIYFRINKLPLCKPLIRALDNADMMQYFPTSEKVTYNYFLGMKSLFDSDYRKAEELLTYSFLNCPSQSFKNKQLILIFLIPVKMLLGHMPKESALQKYKLTDFSPVIRAVKEGNIKAFDESLEQGKDFFWKFGIYLILEKLRIILYRNIFKKVSLIENTHQIPIQSFRAALKHLQGQDIDVEEVHCILANLIFENKIKGYISIQHQKLVVSKQNPFPALASVST